MSRPEFYPASLVKRTRSTKAQLAARRDALVSIVVQMRPMTVRQVFYQAVVKGIVEKTDGGYDAVQRDLLDLRRKQIVPYSAITDSTRFVRRARSHNNLVDALEETAQFYRRSLLAHAGVRIEIWVEKDALSGVIFPVTSRYDVPLMIARGFSSETFIYEIAEEIKECGVPTFVYHLGDFDPSGVGAASKIAQGLKKHAPNADMLFERLGVTERQIYEWQLPTRPTKTSDRRAKNFGEISVDLDAVPPHILRVLVEEAILRHISPDALKANEVAEESERDILRLLTDEVKSLMRPNGRPEQ